MNDVVMTFDSDWAPDFVIDFIVEQLIARRVRSTWFVPFMSPALHRLRQHADLFELGMHPNFLSGSTHGNTPEIVLQHCLKLVPEATSMRTHGLVQSTALLELVLAQTPITTDASLFLPSIPGLRPVEYWWRQKVLWRIPMYWEDDFEAERPTACWQLKPLLDAGQGLKVFNFHPIHVYLNSKDRGPYSLLKQHTPRLFEATCADVRPLVQQGQGPRTLFTELVAYLAGAGQSWRICDVRDHWVASISQK